MNCLRRRVFIFLILTAAFMGECFAREKIVAVVNNEVVTQKDLDDFANFMRLQLSEQLNSRELEGKLQSMRQEILERLIEDRLILQEAKKNGVKVDENRIKARLSSIKKQYPSESDFRQTLARQGLVEADLEQRIREQLLMFSIVEQMVKGKIIIKPEEVTVFYNDNKQEFMSEETRLIEVIVLEKKEAAKSFAFDLSLTEKLEDLATRYLFKVNMLTVSEGDDLRPQIRDTVFKLGLKGVSEPVEMDGRYYVFRLQELIPSRQLSLSEAQDRIHEFLFEKKMQEEMARWLEELKTKSYVKITQD
ncbi:MAG: peptidyl-prolyl cis-trans isomerase [Candidatus Omnitrophota bacterium]